MAQYFGHNPNNGRPSPGIDARDAFRRRPQYKPRYDRVTPKYDMSDRSKMPVPKRMSPYFGGEPPRWANPKFLEMKPDGTWDFQPRRKGSSLPGLNKFVTRIAKRINPLPNPQYIKPLGQLAANTFPEWFKAPGSNPAEEFDRALLDEGFVNGQCKPTLLDGGCGMGYRIITNDCVRPSPVNYCYALQVPSGKVNSGADLVIPSRTTAGTCCYPPHVAPYYHRTILMVGPMSLAANCGLNRFHVTGVYVKYSPRAQSPNCARHTEPEYKIPVNIRTVPHTVTYAPVVTPVAPSIIDTWQPAPRTGPQFQPRVKPYQLPAVTANIPQTETGPIGITNTPHNRLPPKRGERERKRGVKPKIALAVVASIYDSATEAKDIVDILYANLGRKCKGAKSMSQKANCIYNNLDSLDVDAAILDLIQNHYEDKVWGSYFGLSKGLHFGATLTGGKPYDVVKYGG